MYKVLLCLTDTPLYIYTRQQAQQLRNHNSIPGEKCWYSSFPKYWEQIWGPHNIIFNAYCGDVLQQQSGRSIKVTTHLNLVSRSGISATVPPLPHMPSWHWYGQHNTVTGVDCDNISSIIRTVILLHTANI